MDSPHQEKDPYAGIYGLDNLAERISEILKCPVTIEDANHRLLAYSTHDERTDQARIATIIGRRVPEKVINSLWREGVIPYLLNSDEPIRIKSINEVGLGDRIAVSIRKNNEILGFIYALEVDYQLQDKDFLYLCKAAQAVKNHLLSYNSKRNEKEEGYQEFFWQLLTGHLHDDEEIIKRFESLHIIPPDESAVLVFKFPSKIDLKTEKNINYILKTTQRVKVIFHTLDVNKLILLASPQSPEKVSSSFDKFIKAFIQQMEERFAVREVTGGYSVIYGNWERFEKIYKEALNLLEIKERLPVETKNTFCYQELGIYQFLPLLLEQRRSDNYENYHLKLLVQYDERHNTELYNTLEAYLENDCNINQTAKNLHIHANTLNYRLKRISEIAAINLADYNQKITLFVHMKLNKLL
ncbi:MAG: PucR family transcriptional regulator [Bacillota bacterium]